MTSFAASLPDFRLAALACAGRSMQSSTLPSIRSNSSACRLHWEWRHAQQAAQQTATVEWPGTSDIIHQQHSDVLCDRSSRSLIVASNLTSSAGSVALDSTKFSRWIWLVMLQAPAARSVKFQALCFDSTHDVTHALATSHYIEH
jgi:hypothetical protein